MNTQIIAIVNQKGGVGKTTTCELGNRAGTDWEESPADRRRSARESDDQPGKSATGKLQKQRSRDAPVIPHGKQTVKQLVGQNQGISNIGVAVLITYSPQNGVILLVMAFLISPMGLPLAAIWLLGKVQDLKYAIQDWMYG